MAELKEGFGVLGVGLKTMIIFRTYLLIALSLLVRALFSNGFNLISNFFIYVTRN